MNEHKTGFIAPVITEDHLLLGGLSASVIKVDGNWKDYLPDFESQLEATFDEDGCTVYGTLNAIETLERFLAKNNPNYSRRFIYNVVGITPPGSDPHLVATTIRGSGLVNQEDLPDKVDSLAIYMTPRPMTPDLTAKGKNWSWQLGHEWIITPSTPAADRVNIIKAALLKGTVAVSVTAWYKNADGLYYSPPGQQNEHWTMVYDVDETGIYVFDSYQDAVTGNNLKKLTLDHDISYGKMYTLTPKTTPPTNWLVNAINLLISFFKKNLINMTTLTTTVQELSKPVINNQSQPMQPTEQKPIILTTFPPKILAWYKGIKQWEGANPDSNNGGNLKYSTLTAQWGARKGRAASDGGFLATFDTPQAGDIACCNFLVLGCKNQLLAFHDKRTFQLFTKEYAGNPPQSYIQGIADIVSCHLDTDISTFLAS